MAYLQKISLPFVAQLYSKLSWMRSRSLPGMSGTLFVVSRTAESDGEVASLYRKACFCLSAGLTCRTQPVGGAHPMQQCMCVLTLKVQ